MTGDKAARLRRSLVVAVVVGVALGSASGLADGVIRLRVFGMLGNIIAPWTVTAFAVGRRAPSTRSGALAGTLALTVGVLAYYAFQAIRYALAPEIASSGYLVRGLVWGVAALTVGPLIGWCGAATQRRTRTPMLAVVTPAALLSAEAGFLVVDRRPWLWNLANEVYRLNDAAVMVVMLALAFAAPWWLLDDRSRRRNATLLIAVLGLAGAFVLEVFYGLLAR